MPQRQRTTSFSDLDKAYMTQALNLARAAKGSTFPNPAVGAIIVQGGRIVGKGATALAGGPHAEKTALAQAKNRARGATLYATLEPCCHFGRTPPCTDAIINAGITRVIFAAEDPNPLVNGLGAKQLRKAGITVDSGLCGADANRLNEDFNYSIVNKMPFVTLKLALTLDGRIADIHGRSKWITSPQSRTAVHELRRTHAGIVVGRGTLKADDPELTVRHVPGVSPVRFMISTKATIPRNSHFVRDAHDIRSIIVVFGGTHQKTSTHHSGVEIWRTGSSNSTHCITTFLSMAYKEGITSLLIEGGSSLASLFFETQRVQRVAFFYGNKILGNGLSGLITLNPLSINKAATLADIEFTQYDTDWMVTGRIRWEDSCLQDS